MTGAPRESGSPAEPHTYAIVVARFYSELADRLVKGAVRGLVEAGCDPDGIAVFDVPGSFELAPAAKMCAEAGRFSGVVCLGAVIRGETDHHEHVSRAAEEGILRVSLDTGVPCSFGVITCDTMDQAIARTGEKRDQGYDAARSVLALAALRRSLGSV